MTIVQKWGNSLAVRIPKNIAVQYHLEVGRAVDLVSSSHGVLLRSAEVKIPSLAKLVRGITKKNRHHLADWLNVKPLGKEVW